LGDVFRRILRFQRRRGWCHVHLPLEGDILKYAIQLNFPATNNIAEIEGLVTSLRLTKEFGIHQLLIRGDSQLVAKQVQKEYDYNNDKMVEYLAEVNRMEKFFDGFEVWYVPYLDNRDAYHLAWITSSRASTLLDAIVEKLSKPSVKPIESSNQDLMVIDEPEQEPAYNWMNPIKMFLENQPLSDDNTEVERITHKLKQYHLIDGILFR
jgi:ribonuclease HI